MIISRLCDGMNLQWLMKSLDTRSKEYALDAYLDYAV